MPDISMCANQHCEDRDTCYRYLAIPSCIRQSCIRPAAESKQECGHYWKDDGSMRTVKSNHPINKDK